MDYEWVMLDSTGYLVCGPSSETGRVAAFWRGENDPQWWGLNSPALSLPGVGNAGERVQWEEMDGQRIPQGNTNDLLQDALTMCK